MSYTHSAHLFLKENGDSMQFYMRPCIEKRDIRGPIEYGGGTLLTQRQPDCIYLVSRDSKKCITNSEESRYKSQYIWDCIKANKQLDIERYKIQNSGEVTSSDDEDLDLDESKDVQNKMMASSYRKHSRQQYTLEEDKKIIKYIQNFNDYNRVKGTQMWQEMEDSGVIPGRTWQSLKERFLKRILSRLHDFDLTKIERKRLCSLSTGNKNVQATSPLKKKPYTLEEENAILKYICDNNGYECVKGIALYKEMERKNVVRHTWQSIRNHLIKTMSKNLQRYNMTAYQLNRLEGALGVLATTCSKRKTISSMLEDIAISSDSESDEPSMSSLMPCKENKATADVNKDQIDMGVDNVPSTSSLMPCKENEATASMETQERVTHVLRNYKRMRKFYVDKSKYFDSADETRDAASSKKPSDETTDQSEKNANKIFHTNVSNKPCKTDSLSSKNDTNCQIEQSVDQKLQKDVTTSKSPKGTVLHVNVEKLPDSVIREMKDSASPNNQATSPHFQTEKDVDKNLLDDDSVKTALKPTKRTGLQINLERLPESVIKFHSAPNVREPIGSNPILVPYSDSSASDDDLPEQDKISEMKQSSKRSSPSSSEGEESRSRKIRRKKEQTKHDKNQTTTEKESTNKQREDHVCKFTSTAVWKLGSFNSRSGSNVNTPQNLNMHNSNLSSSSKNRLWTEATSAMPAAGIPPRTEEVSNMPKTRLASTTSTAKVPTPVPDINQELVVETMASSLPSNDAITNSKNVVPSENQWGFWNSFDDKANILNTDVLLTDSVHDPDLSREIQNVSIKTLHTRPIFQSPKCLLSVKQLFNNVAVDWRIEDEVADHLPVTINEAMSLEEQIQLALSSVPKMSYVVK